MLRKLQVNHLVYSTTRPFDEVVRAFEAAVGTLEDIGWASIPENHAVTFSAMAPGSNR